MNYRHAFHAGNFADVVKHAALLWILRALKRKDAPFCVVDVHAGVGRYDLTGSEAQKTGEYRDGIARLWKRDDLPPMIGDYAAAIRAFDADGRLSVYPGSPCLARAEMRPQDRLILNELHPEDRETLGRVFAGDGQVVVHGRDAYEELSRALPPKIPRGVVLIDPPFEVPGEFERVAAALPDAVRRWPTGIFVAWHPIKDKAAIWRFHDALEHSGLRRILALEFMVAPEDDPRRLNGCGMTFVNPPWRLDEALAEDMPRLLAALGRAEKGAVKVEWIVPE